jgi:DNA repair exonuclease SbcCD nuclease subunit
MPVRFIHTSDLHLGKTYRGSAGEAERYEDFFRCLSAIVADAIREQVDFVLIAGDLFHTGQILPRTFARTIETLAPLKESGIPCIAVEGNHDWIHRRDNISWMEAISQMGYLRLLRPSRLEDGGYRFDAFDAATGLGGHLEIGRLNIYGLGYIGAAAGQHVERICQAVTTRNNLLLFHVGIWTFSPVEIGNMQPAEALPLAEVFDYVALGHGHKPYIVETPQGRPYAFNPGAPERVNLGEEQYPKGYYLVNWQPGTIAHQFRATDPRPMRSLRIDLDGAGDAETALQRFREQVAAVLAEPADPRQPVLDLKLSGRVGFHPFELGRERLRLALEEYAQPLHLELRNHLSLVSQSGAGEPANQSLAEIEREVLEELIAARSEFKGRETELVTLSLAIRDLVLQGEAEGADLLALLEREG